MSSNWRETSKLSSNASSSSEEIVEDSFEFVRKSNKHKRINVISDSEDEDTQEDIADTDENADEDDSDDTDEDIDKINRVDSDENINEEDSDDTNEDIDKINKVDSDENINEEDSDDTNEDIDKINKVDSDENINEEDSDEAENEIEDIEENPIEASLPIKLPKEKSLEHDFKNTSIDKDFTNLHEFDGLSSTRIQFNTTDSYVIKDDSPVKQQTNEHSESYVIESSNDNNSLHTKSDLKVIHSSVPDNNEIDDDDEDVVKLGANEVHALLAKKPMKDISNISAEDTGEEVQVLDSFIQVTESEYKDELVKLQKIKDDIQRNIALLKNMNLSILPDKGLSIKTRQTTLERAQAEQESKIKKLKVVAIKKELPLVPWTQIEAGAKVVQPKTFGKQALATINLQRQLTMDRLQQLHGSIENRPKDTDLMAPPEGLKVELMVHQRSALSWLMWRETQKPPGGILADDMGLGKTLTMISLILKSRELGGKDTHHSDSGEDSDENDWKNRRSSKKYKGGTLVVCPASLLNQWSEELVRRTKKGLLSFNLYHGPKRETKSKTLAKYDVVFTTYAIVSNEFEKNGPVFNVKWSRIIIDEAHQIRNYKSKTCNAICELHSKYRWALTGTPVHNKELDMYSQLKFLRCTPFDDLTIWKRWITDKSKGGCERLCTVISSIMLRRTKEELAKMKLLNVLPERTYELIPVPLVTEERGVYSKILIFSKTLFAQFLYQRAERNQGERFDLDSRPNEEYFKMRQKLLRLNKLKDIKQHEILVLLLRLRQICNHPSLIINMLSEDSDVNVLGDDIDELEDKMAGLNILDQLQNLSLSDHPNPNNSQEDINQGASCLKEAANAILKPSDPIFEATRMSSKMSVLFKLIKEKLLNNEDKAVVVSQWPSFLQLIAYHLKEENIPFCQLDGKVPVPKRQEIIDQINDPKKPAKILLLSLTAGGVGLNLMGANHLFILDLHWNPQMENQAVDRVYRVGQMKPVFVYKLMAAETIEKGIFDLQKKKLNIADSMLTGSKSLDKNKLTLQDLKQLFEM
ncbi:unnamed protein product [Phyllotreta striolata]|uniref:Transcription termination factor 2 n=1 Tax=Phyllotreta striolata TaxID=444603 RepID=A0A9N9TPL1_PHYSR|nr:unnamed protein product [Phyllotreta striolata]